MKDDQILHLTTPEEQAQSKAALKNAIAWARRSEILGIEGAPHWEDETWTLDGLVERGSAASASTKVLFHSVANDDESYPAYWADVLKFIVLRKLHKRFDRGEKFASGTINGFSHGGRSLIDYLRAAGFECITEVGKSDIKDIFAAPGSSESVRGAIKEIVEIMVEADVTPQLSGLRLKHAGKKRDRTNPSKVKPTTWDELIALAATFQLLEPDENPLSERSDFDYLRVSMAMANLLVCAPSRNSELWRLPADAAIVTSPLADPAIQATVPDDEREALDFKFAMTWHPSKGGRPVIKPVPGAMQFVACRCLEILASYSEAPRRTARWIMENPGVMPIPAALKDLRAYRDMEHPRIQTDEVKALLGAPPEAKLVTSSLWNKAFRNTGKTAEGSRQLNKVTYCFRTLQQDWWHEFQRRFKAAFKSEWPYVVKSDELNLTADRALLLFYAGALETRTEKAAYKTQLFFTTPRPTILDGLLGETKNSNVSIWERLGIRLPNGESPHINTHQLRHYLNTLAQRAGIPQAVIAMWSGRANIAQNAVYDHRTDAERLRAHGVDVPDYDAMQVDDLLTRQIDQLYAGTIGLPSIDVLSTPEGGVRDLEKRRLVSINQFGYCVGDLHKDPCPKAVNCLSCARLVVCKGAEKATRFLEQKVARLAAQKTELERHVEEDGGWRLGSDHILPLLEEQLSGAQDLLMALRDPDIPDGSILSMRDHRGAQTATLADRTQTFIAQRKALEAERKEVSDGEA